MCHVQNTHLTTIQAILLTVCYVCRTRSSEGKGELAMTLILMDLLKQKHKQQKDTFLHIQKQFDLNALTVWRS